MRATTKDDGAIQVNMEVITSHEPHTIYAIANQNDMDGMNMIECGQSMGSNNE